MKRALFAGSFDPVTNGHLNLVERARVIFDELVIAVAAGHHKTPLFTLEEREAMFRDSTAHLTGVDVVSFSGLLVDEAKKRDCRVVVRGLRMVSDFEYEYQMALMNRKLDPEFETVFLMPSARFAFVNSTVIKEIARFGGSLDGLVPEPVLAGFRQKFGSTA